MAAHLRRRDAEAAAAARARDVALRLHLPAAAELLRERGATSVRLFGSLARGEATATSDIDLAVAGLPSRDYFPTLADLMALCGCPVDLVRIEEAPPSLLDCIRAEGRDL